MSTAAVERVIVVGAGIAGLSAARELTRAGIECVVLEARDRTGGRLFTADVGGSPVDMGGSWIHTPEGNPLSELVRSAGIATRPGNFVADVTGFDRLEGRRLSADEQDELNARMHAGFPEWLEEQGAGLGRDTSMADAIDRYLAGSGLAPAQARRLRAAVKLLQEADATDFLETQPAAPESEIEHYGGDYLGDMPVGGYSRVIAALAEGLDVRLGCVVSAVSATDRGVEVTLANGVVERGSHMIVTVPLGVLKHRDIVFSPPLEADRLAAIDRLTFGRFEKIALRFERAFWRDAGVTHLLVYPRHERESAVTIFGMDAFGAGPLMLAFVFRSATDWLDRASRAEAVDWVREMVSEAIGAPCPEPQAVAFSDWGKDPFSRGAYTSVPLGATAADVRRLAEPAGPRVLFAGEATSAKRLGFADGALSSGTREAARLLGRE